MKPRLLCWTCLVFLWLCGCRYSAYLNFDDFNAPSVVIPYSAKGTPVQEIPIWGPASKARAEISGLEWYGDTLILLPQYPSRFFGGSEGALITFKKEDIIRYLEGKETTPLVPGYLPFYAPGIDVLPGFEGFEAIAIKDDTVFLTAETHVGLWQSMMGYLIRGKISPDMTSVVMDVKDKVELFPLSDIMNLSHEALLVWGDEIVAFYEGNGIAITSNPVAYRYDLASRELPPLSFPNIEYRITDVTAPDEDNYFWAINYFYPGDERLENDDDPLVTIYGNQFAHVHNEPVERIVEFQISDNGITLSKRNPIRIKLADSGESRNWEGIVRLDEKGFLVVTDKTPSTILGFIPRGGENN
ncbi:MAG: hypothetical protein HPY59_06625 [Anaerolineae bacterium]|nr:hypothetical protein [Anaerolineae bacterium]